MRILIFGAGAIGSLLGYRLSQAKHEVILVGRPNYVQAVQARGLLLEERHSVPYEPTKHPDRDRHPAHHGHAAHPQAVEKIEDIPASQRAWELTLLTVKAYDTQDATQALASYLSPEMPLLVVQNGVGGEEMVQQVLGQANIISGVITLAVSVLAPAHIRLDTTRGGLSLAPTQEGQAVDSLAQLFAAAGMKTVTCRDYRAQKWSKLLLNMLANALPAILDMSPSDVFANPRLFDIERSAFLEALHVMRALGVRPINLPGYPVPILAWAMRTLPASLLRALLSRIITSGRGGKKPSLQIDLTRGRERSEVLYLNGAIVTHAERLGLNAPVNRVLVDTLMSIATGNVSWDEFRGQPQKLIAALH